MEGEYQIGGELGERTSQVSTSDAYEEPLVQFEFVILDNSKVMILRLEISDK